MKSVLTLAPLTHRSTCGNGFATSEFHPAVDIVERADDYVVRLDVPGFARDDLEVSVENDTLEIRGRQSGDTTDGETVLRRERASGEFTRTFRLGRQVDAGQVSASHANGVLEVRVAKAADAKPRRIELS